jgi:uncharacterized protein YqeY
MEVLAQIDNDLIAAQKDRNELVVMVLRQLKTALANAEIAKNREALTSEEIIKILRSEVKRRNESSELYRKGGRVDLAQKEEDEIVVIENYLPAQLSEAQLIVIVDKAIEQTQAETIKDMGKVMEAVNKEAAGAADGKIVSQLVKQRLQK